MNFFAILSIPQWQKAKNNLWHNTDVIDSAAVNLPGRKI